MIVWHEMKKLQKKLSFDILVLGNNSEFKGAGIYRIGWAKDYYIDGQNNQLIFFEIITTEGGKMAPQITPWVDFLDHDLL